MTRKDIPAPCAHHTTTFKEWTDDGKSYRAEVCTHCGVRLSVAWLPANSPPHPDTLRAGGG